MSRACTRNAKVERDGRGYCTQHDPERIKAKDAERKAAWDAKWAAERERGQRQRALNALADGIPTDALERIRLVLDEDGAVRVETVEAR